MSITDKSYIGIDLSKSTMDVYSKLSGHSCEKNEPAGIRRLIKQISKNSKPHVIVEPTGGYERKLVEALREADIEFTLVNPRQARDFAKAQGRLAKTDKIDAKVLADFGQAMQPAPSPKPSRKQQELIELTRRRDQLSEMLLSERNRLEHAATPAVMASHKKFIRELEKQIKQIEETLECLIESDDDLNGKMKRLCEVKGVGKLTAIKLLSELPELGHLNRKEVAALSGLAPMNHDSGKYKGTRYVCAGRAAVRKAVYMAALVASRHNPMMKSFYDRLIAAGKPKKVALVAVMRKLVILLNAIIKHPHYCLS